MNNAWASIAIRGPCAARPARTQPLLQLFNGYARSQSTRSFTQWSSHQSRQCMKHKAFSTSACLSARSSKRPPPPMRDHPSARPKAEQAVSESKLEPAPTVASHTEGLPPEPPEEQLTWRDYDPEGGMPLPNGELSQAEINAVFNSEEIDVDTGNYIISVMHWRRMSGALIDVGLDFPRESQVSKDQALKGLEYVRTVLPEVDEAANGGVWVDEETQRVRQEMQDRAVKLGLYKAEDEDVREEDIEDNEFQQGTEEGRERTSQSILQQVRAKNEARYEQWKKEKDAAEERDRVNAINSARGPLEMGGGVQPRIITDVQKSIDLPFGVKIRPPSSNAYLTTPREKPAWVKYAEDQAMIIKDNTVPNISTLRRLGPPFLVLLAVLAGCYYLHQNYTPPPTSARIWPDTPPAVATLWAITGVLVATFFLGRTTRLWRFFNKYMACTPAYPEPFSIIGCTFRHDKPSHLAGNLISLWLFGLMLHDDVGRGTFLAIYLGAGAFGGFSALAYNVLRKQWATYIFGCSGSVLGVVGAVCALRPNGTVKVMGYEVPIAAWALLGLYTGAEAFAAIRGAKTTIDHAGHLGGVLFGVVSALLLQARANQTSAAEEMGNIKDEIVMKATEKAET